MKQQSLERVLLSVPGETILETIEHMKMSQAELAERMGKTASKINDLIHGKEPITVNTALQLEKVLGIPADFWLAREASYREKLGRIEEEEKIECWVPWAKLHPLKELRKLGFISHDKLESGTVRDLLLFYGIVSPEQWEIMYVPQYRVANYRKSGAYQASVACITSWLRIGEQQMQKLELPNYSKDGFKKTLEGIRNLARNHPMDFAAELQKRCVETGVGLVYTEMIPSAPISGAARWIGGSPMIQLTDRGKFNDKFWFTFFHEAAHILLHGKKEVFLEEVSDHVEDAGKEEEANEFAANWLLPEDFIKDVPMRITDDVIVAIASKYKMHPGIVVGRLQKMGRLQYSEGRKFKVEVSLFR